MVSFHINDEGIASECHAQIECRLSPTSEHFGSKKEAYAHYETKMDEKLFEPVESSTRRLSEKSVALAQDTLSRVEALGVKDHNLENLGDGPWTKNEYRMMTDFHEMSVDASVGTISDSLVSKTSGYHFAKEMLSDRERLILADMEKLMRRQLDVRKVNREV